MKETLSAEPAAPPRSAALGAKVDLHSHLVPGVDDGARTIEQARFALVMMRDEGVGAIITTPHVNGTVTADPKRLRQRLAELDRGWRSLLTLVRREFPELTVHRGTEVMLDIPKPDLSDPRLRLAGTRFVLVEFPHMVIPPRSTDALRSLIAAGWTPVIAHPERYGGMRAQLGLADEWRRVGCYLQVNGTSLLGSYSAEARRVAIALLEQGWVDLFSSDYHAHGQPRIRDVWKELVSLGGEQQAGLLMESNPRRILEDTPPLAVPPLQRTPRTFWERLAGALRDD